MSLREAIDLIRADLPATILRAIDEGVSSSEQASWLSVRDFSFAHIADPNNFRYILERRVKFVDQRASRAQRRCHEDRLNFVRDAFAESSAQQLWQGYCMVEVPRWLIGPSRKRLVFLVNAERQKVLKYYDPYPLFEST